MKDLKTYLATLVAVFVLGGVACAADCPCKKTNVEVYAHPSLFGSQTFEYSTDDGAYIKGGNIVKSKQRISIHGKDNVAIKAWANSILTLLKNQYTNASLFSPKNPLLRSEWAVVLAEGFDLKKNKTCAGKYTDIAQDYWATGWVCAATDADIMIGYPEKVFKPDQPITKAEVFATISQIVIAETDESAKNLMYHEQKMEYIPAWANDATANVIATGLLDYLPNSKTIASAEYLSKEQIVYLVGALRTDLAYYQKLKLNPNAPIAIQKYVPTTLYIKMDNRLSAKHSNIGDVFTAQTTKSAIINGKDFPVKSTVTGKVVNVSRPGLNHPGYISVKFLTISNGTDVLEFPKEISEASADTIKSPFFVGRLLAFPLTGSGRVLGVIGRTGGAIADTCGNRLEEVGDNLGNMFVNSAEGHVGAGAKNLGGAFISIGKGVYDLGKVAVSGVFGVIYEVTDEIVYVILPSASNDSSLNPNEELVIIF